MKRYVTTKLCAILTKATQLESRLAFPIHPVPPCICTYLFHLLLLVVVHADSCWRVTGSSVPAHYKQHMVDWTASFFTVAFEFPWSLGLLHCRCWNPSLEESLHVFVWFYAWCFPFHRGRKALENRTNLDDDKIEMLEQMLKEATEAANDSERKYEEVCLIKSRIIASC